MSQSLKVERLEERVLMTANVRVLGGGQVVVSGDAAVDNILIDAGTVANSIDITADFGAGVATQTILNVQHLSVLAGEGLTASPLMASTSPVICSSTARPVWTRSQ